MPRFLLLVQDRETPKDVSPMPALKGYEMAVNKVLEKQAIWLFISQLQQ